MRTRKCSSNPHRFPLADRQTNEWSVGFAEHAREFTSLDSGRCQGNAVN